MIWQAVIGLLTATMDKTPKKEPDSIHLPVSWMETHLIDELFSLFISSRARLKRTDGQLAFLQNHMSPSQQRDQDHSTGGPHLNWIAQEGTSCQPAES